MKSDGFDDAYLQRLVEEVSLRDFGKPFRHKATFNRRLKSTGGRYILKTHNLELNPKQLEVYGEEELIRIIRHELCHYHLHLEGKGFRHRDREFKECLAKVGGARYCQPVAPVKKQPYRYLLVCTGCKHGYLRKKKMNPDHYRCGRCGGRLRLCDYPPE